MNPKTKTIPIDVLRQELSDIESGKITVVPKFKLPRKPRGAMSIGFLKSEKAKLFYIFREKVVEQICELRVESSFKPISRKDKKLGLFARGPSLDMRFDYDKLDCLRKATEQLFLFEIDREFQSAFMKLFSKGFTAFHAELSSNWQVNILPVKPR